MMQCGWTFLQVLLGACLFFLSTCSAAGIPGTKATMPPDYMFGNEHGCDGKALLVSPAAGMGLNNQVNLLVHAIYIGIVTGRNVCVLGFGVSFDIADKLNAAWIYDMAYINAAIANTGIVQRMALKDAKIKRAISVRTAHAHDYYAAHCLILKGEGGNGMRNCPFNRAAESMEIRRVEKNFVGILQFLQREDISKLEKVSLTPGIPGQRTGFESEDDDRHIHDIHLFIRFAPAFYELTNILLHKNGIESGEAYTAVHFRLEDDALSQYHTFNYWEYEEEQEVKDKGLKFMWPREEHDVWVGAKFVQQIVKAVNRTEKLYLSTGLHKRQNRLNFVLDLLDSYYVNMKANDLLNSNFDEQNKEILLPIRGREVAAIIDYIIACKATHFIGISASTFSANIMRTIKHRKGISDRNYGKAEIKLHERNPLYNPLLPKTPEEKKKAQVIVAKKKLVDLDLLSFESFAAKSFMFSVRDMNLTANLPTDLHFLNETLAIPGVCSGIQFINRYRVDNCQNKGILIKRPWVESFPGNAAGLIEA